MRYTMYTARATSISLKCQGTPLRGVASTLPQVGQTPPAPMLGVSQNLLQSSHQGTAGRGSDPAHGEDRHVVAQRLGREVPSRLQQGLAQDGGILARVPADHPGDAVLAEDLPA